MKKIISYLLVATLAVACTKEDSLEPTGAKENYFVISPDATDATSVLRRNFYEKNKIHLLFNDTLCHEQRGTYADGTPYWFTETIDLQYSMTNQDNTLRYTYLKDIDEQEKAIEFIQNYIISHLSLSMRPYSFFLVKTLEWDRYDNDKWQTLNYYTGMRCHAIRVGGVENMSDDEMSEYCTEIFFKLIKERLGSINKEILSHFYSFCDVYYDEDYVDFDMDNYPEPEELYELGFIEFDDWYFPTKSEDRNAYLEAIFYEEETEFKTRYAEYPIILQKYDILKKLIEDQGFKF